MWGSGFGVQGSVLCSDPGVGFRVQGSALGSDPSVGLRVWGSALCSDPSLASDPNSTPRPQHGAGGSQTAAGTGGHTACQVPAPLRLTPGSQCHGAGIATSARHWDRPVAVVGSPSLEVLKNYGDEAVRDVVSGRDGHGLDSVVLEIFSSLNDSIILPERPHPSPCTL